MAQKEDKRQKKGVFTVTISATPDRPRSVLSCILLGVLGKYRKKICAQELYAPIFSVQVSPTPRAARSVYIPLLTQSASHVTDVHVALQEFIITAAPRPARFSVFEEAVRLYLREFSADEYSVEKISSRPLSLRIHRL